MASTTLPYRLLAPKSIEERAQILVISLDDTFDWDDDQNVWSALQEKADLIVAKSTTRAFQHLGDIHQAVLVFNAIIVPDASLTTSCLLAQKLVNYTESGGTVVFGFGFAFSAAGHEISQFFASNWPETKTWEVTEGTFRTNNIFNARGHETWWPHAERWGVKKIHRIGNQWIDPLWPDLEGVYVSNVDEDSQVFYAIGPVYETMGSSCVVFQNVGGGWLGFVGTRNCPSAVYIVMCNLHNKAEANRVQEEEWEKVRGEKEAKKVAFFKQWWEHFEECKRAEEEQNKRWEDNREMHGYYGELCDIGLCDHLACWTDDSESDDDSDSEEDDSEDAESNIIKSEDTDMEHTNVDAATSDDVNAEEAENEIEAGNQREYDDEIVSGDGGFMQVDE